MSKKILSIDLGTGNSAMAIYENGAMIDSLVKDDCTVESIEAMIKKHI